MGFRRGRQSGDRSRILPASTLADPHRQTGKWVPLDFPRVGAARRSEGRQCDYISLSPSRSVVNVGARSADVAGARRMA
jgi:hypothetical protein